MKILYPRKDKHNMNLNLPNKLTVIRMVLIPFFMAGMIVSQHFYGDGVNVFVLISLAIFIVASITDWFD